MHFVLQQSAATRTTPCLLSRILSGIVTDNSFVQGYEWVGWRNDTPNMLGRPVEITFEFDYSRNFTAIHLHMNNYFTKDVQVSPHAPLPVLFRKLRAFANYRKFHDHTFGDASALLSGFKNISVRFTARRFLARASNRRLLASLVFSSTAKFRRCTFSHRITFILAFYLRKTQCSNILLPALLHIMILYIYIYLFI